MWKGKHNACVHVSSLHEDIVMIAKLWVLETLSIRCENVRDRIHMQ
jgi:hypothetical protein